MPKRNDIKSILIIGAGPIVIGQACEFDYSGSQACKILKEEGYRIILINSNPATIMTDPDFADATYIEPITPEMVEKINTPISMKQIDYPYNNILTKYILFIGLFCMLKIEKILNKSWLQTVIFRKK